MTANASAPSTRAAKASPRSVVLITLAVGLGLPWLQDTAEEMVGASWGAEHFDLVILGPDNVGVAVYSLIEYDLSDPANYDEIKRALASIADQQSGTAGMYGDAHGAGVFGVKPQCAATPHCQHSGLRAWQT